MKKMKIDFVSAFEDLANKEVKWKEIAGEGLSLSYAVILPKHLAGELMKELENSIEYFEGDLAKVKVFGKWHPIPRQQVAFGDEGLQYRFSGLTVEAKSWTDPLKSTRDFISKITGHDYNFVLINRYRNGTDHIGEHRDDESELDPNVPIASLSLGQHRDFLLKHIDCRKKGPTKRNIKTEKIELQHGSLLLMNPPTNKFWYHSLPPRKNAPGVRLNLTFRKLTK